MTFLQPFILWGLPLLLLPVLIHLFNRLRHRPMPWAAMMFLRSATRKSTRYARLRQWLVLLFRVLAVLVLILALSRPLSGGWLGWMMATAPDVILLVQDRSASMEARDAGQALTKRGTALKLFADGAKSFEETSRLVLLESAARAPQEVAGTAMLAEMSATAATDTAADLPAQLQTALDWFAQNRPGSGEIWIASDLQRSNWRPDSDRWPALAAGLAALPQRVRVRLLALNKESEGNASVAIQEVTRRPRDGQAALEIVLDVERNTTGAATLPLVINVDGARSQVELKMDGQSLRYRHIVPLAGKDAEGWGFVELPADANLADNKSYFVYGAPPALRAAVISTDQPSRRFLQLAVAPDPKNTNQVCEIIAAAGIENANWADYSMVLWQGAPPTGGTAARLQAFAESGGMLVFFPPGAAGKFATAGWGEMQIAPADKPFSIARWEESDGPLAKTEEGLSLPLSELAVQKRQLILGEKSVLATFADGTPFLTRRVAGRGQILFCASLPNSEWSQLNDGAVLVPMLQRLLQAGGRRFARAGFLECGDVAALGTERWTAVDGAAPKEIRLRAGVYRGGGRLVAVNRPAREDEREILEAAKAKLLFGAMPVQLFEEQRSGEGKLQSELWRMFLFGMALFLIVEAVLILPDRAERTDGKKERVAIA